MTEYIRVKETKTGHELSVPFSHFKATRGAYQKLDKPATYPAGDPLPPKYKRTVEQAADQKAAAKKTTTKSASIEDAKPE